MLCLDNSFCSGQSCRSTRYLVRKYLKVLTISIMLLGRIHFNMVLLTAHNYAQRSAVCAVGAESRWRAFLHSWCDAGLYGNYFILALAKTVTPRGGPRREPGRAVPLTTKRSSLARKFSRCGEPIAYTDLLCLGVIFAQLRLKTCFQRVLTRLNFLILSCCSNTISFDND